MLPAMFQYFESESDIGVWYLLYGYLKNDLLFADNQIRLFDTYRSQALPSLSLVALQSFTRYVESAGEIPEVQKQVLAYHLMFVGGLFQDPDLIELVQVYLLGLSVMP